MRELSRADQGLPEIRQLAELCNDPSGLDSYLRKFWHYKPDPEWAEYVQSPQVQLMIGMEDGFYMGDCDDAATFAGAIALAMGYSSRFTAYRLPGKREFSHVNLRCLVPHWGLFDVDPTVSVSQLPILGAEEILEVHL
jgi:hypothetical protein